MVNILDHNGTPLRTQDLKTPQTDRARLASITNTFAGHPSRGLTPAKLATILEQAEQGDLVAQNELFEDMEEKDGHIHAELGKRRRALLGVPWRIDPPNNATTAEKHAAELVNELMDAIPDIDDVILDMADAIGKGYSCLEYDGWHQIEKYQVPKAIIHRPATWFTVNRDDHNELMLRTDGEPVSLTPFGWITHIHKAKAGYVARSGLGRILSWPFLFKNYSVRDLAEFLEIYGLPLRLGTYPRGATPEEKTTLLQAVVGIGHNAAGIMPEGMAIEFHEAAKGASDPFEFMISWCERTQSKAILGGTLTSQADGKSSTNALGNVHNEVRQDLRNSDLKQIAATLTRDLLYPLAAVNVPGITNLLRSPRLVFDVREPEDMALYAESLPKLVEIGMQIPADYAHEKLNIPKPEKDQVILKYPQTPPPEPTALAALRDNTLPSVDAVLEQALKKITPQQLQGQSEALLGPVLAQLEQGADLEQIQASLSEHFPEMDTSDMEEMLSRLYFVAEVWGRLNAAQ